MYTGITQTGGWYFPFGNFYKKRRNKYEKKAKHGLYTKGNGGGFKKLIC